MDGWMDGWMVRQEKNLFFLLKLFNLILRFKVDLCQKIPCRFSRNMFREAAPGDGWTEELALHYSTVEVCNIFNITTSLLKCSAFYK
jgi:hypothetical protein